MTTNQESAAEVILRNNARRYPFSGPEGTAQALADAGLIAPDLPKPAYEGSTPWNVPGKHEWATDSYRGEVMLVVDIDENYRRPKTWFMKPAEARTLAMAILAAVNHTEKAETHE